MSRVVVEHLDGFAPHRSLRGIDLPQVQNVTLHDTATCDALFADAGYQGPQFAMAVAQILPELAVEIVKRSDQASGFVVLPMRWVVERTLAWLNRCRRLAKDFENLSHNALAFLRLASIRLMLRKLCNPT